MASSSSSFLGNFSDLFASQNSKQEEHNGEDHPPENDTAEEKMVATSCSSSSPEDLLAASNEAALALSALIGMRHENGNISNRHNGGENGGEGIGAGGGHWTGLDVAASSASSPSTSNSAAPINVTSNKTAGAEGDAESGDEVPPAEGMEGTGENGGGAPVHEIRCGLLTARLHMQRFTCPGIHRKCVEFEGKLISPRQFTIKAEKDKQKDWKGSIRLGKHNLRTLMEMKTLDFYEHSTNCSLKCQSRNYIKNRKAEGANNDTITSAGMGGENEEDNTKGTLTMMGTGAFDLTEPNEVHSTTSSAASTRKSSAVLEDYVSQTIPSVNGTFLGGLGGPFSSLNGGDEQHQLKRDSEQLLLLNNNNNSKALPTQAPQVGVSNSASLSSSANSRLGTPATFDPPANSTAPPPGTPSFPFLAQQSPLKQLFGAVQSPKMQPTTHLFAHQQSVLKSPPIGLRTPQQSMEVVSHQQQDNTLAQLLQSLQTSILMEQQMQQQQKATNNNPNNNTISLNLLSSLLNGTGALTAPATNGVQQQQSIMGNSNINNNNNLLNGLEAAIVAGQQNGSSQWNGTNASQSNGIERLLSAAALFPQIVQPPKATPPMAVRQQKLVGAPAAGNGGANVRKSMEDNPSLFWSQMRSMGLLEDMLNTLSGTLERLKHIYLNGGNVVSEEFAARRLSGVALALDLCTLFSDKIHNRCIQATLETSLITKELMELQRKQEEQKRKLENAKRKSQMFELLKGAAARGGSGGANGVGGGGRGRGAGGAESPPESKKMHLNMNI